MKRVTHLTGPMKGHPHRCSCMAHVFSHYAADTHGPHHERDCEMWTVLEDLPTWFYLGSGVLFVVGSALRLLGY